MKKRLDQFLVDEGLFESRARARAAVMEGQVSVDGSSAVKPGTQVSGEESILVSDTSGRFVSRGGTKLCAALDALAVDVEGRTVLDVGASTGGFTDCLLQRGAAHVTAVDVGRGQLHWKLRRDPRVEVMEGVNARELRAEDLRSRPDIAVIDVSFISLRKVMRPVTDVLAPGGRVLALVKPQFEAGRGQVGKGGVVRDPVVHVEVLQEMVDWLKGRGLVPKGLAASPIKGPKGNIEFFLLVGGGGAPVVRADIEREVRRAHGQAV